MDARWDGATDFYARPGLHVEIYGTTLPGAWSDVPFLIAQAQEVGGPVLELASGTGRVVWPMAEAGFDIVGLDLNQSMIDVAEAQRPKYPAAVRDRARFVRGNMAGFDLGRRFSLIYITFRSFQAMRTPEDQKRCLQCVRRHLSPGGRFVVDLFDPRLDMCDPGYREPDDDHRARNPVTGLDVSIKTLERRNDPVNQRLVELWRFQEFDETGNTVREEYERLELRWTYRYEMRYLLELCGFEVLAEYSDFKKSPPAYGNEQVWVARKPADSG